MDEIRKLEDAINALSAQREAIGNEVTDSALRALRLQLDELRRELGREERKQVTVLFSDLVDFTSLSEKLDPEELREMMDRYLRSWSNCILEQGGVVEKFIGDAVMAVFGLHAAQEDDPQRAIRAALHMGIELSELNRDFESRFEARLSMRTGIHTGPVLISTLGERPGQEFVVVGDAVNLASRIQSAAPQNAILITEDTRRLVYGLFEMRPLEALTLKGISDPVPVFQVLAERGRSSHVPRGLRGAQASLVGRQAELGRLQLIFERVIEERRTWVLTITGDPGIGKTRLLAEFEAWLATRSISLTIFKTVANERSASMPYWMLRSAFSQWCRILDSDPIDVARSKFELNVTPYFADAGQLKTHWIGSLLGFDYSGSPFLKNAFENAGSLQERALDYLSEFFCSLSERTFVFLLLDDIQWADSASLEALQAVARACPNLPLLVVCLARQRLDEIHPQWKARLVGTNHASLWMSLRPLSPDESRQILVRVLGIREQPPAELESLVLEAAGGNPYYLEEYLKMLMEEGILSRDPQNGSWSFDQTRLQAVHVPSSLTSVIQGRLDSLAPLERRTLQKASVIGDVFWDRLLIAMDESESALETPLATLQHRTMVQIQAQSTFENMLEYRFNQSLLRDVVYETILKRHRRSYHAVIARWLSETAESRGRGDEFAALIANHYIDAGDSGSASGWLLRAGRNAHRQWALVEARRFLDQAVQTAETEDLQLRWSILLERDQLLGELGDLPARQADDQSLLELAVDLGGSERRALAYRQVSGTLYQAGEMHKSLEAIDIALEAAQQAGLKEMEAYICGWKIPLLVAIGELEQAGQMAQTARRLVETLDDDFERARILVNLSIFFMTSGDLVEAVHLLEQQVEISHSAGLFSGEAHGLNNLGYCLIRLGRFDHARQVFEKALALCGEIGFKRQLAYVQLNLGLVLHFSAGQEEARRMLEAARTALAAAGDAFGHAFGLSYLALVLQKTGHIDQACDVLEQASAIFHQNDLLDYAWEAQARLARCLLADGELEKAVGAASLVWEYLKNNPQTSMESPVEAYLACAVVFIAAGEVSTGRQALERARQELLARADRINQPEWKRAFIEEVPAHREVLELWRQVNLPESGPSRPEMS